MIKNFRNRPFSYPLAVVTLLLSTLVFLAFESNKKAKPARFKQDPNTVNIPGGSFYMGASDEQMDMAMINRKKLVSVSSFWMDRAEITNSQYRKFVKYVSDSLIYLAVYGGGINQGEDTIKVDWNKAAKINQKSKAVIEKLNELLLSPDNRIRGKIDIDPTKLIYRYSSFHYLIYL